MKRFADRELFLLDMDGTVYLGDRWIDGARDFLKRVRDSGRRAVFLTNNASRGAGDYVRKLAAMGVAVDEREIVTSGEVTAEYLRRTRPDGRYFVLGTGALKEVLRARGLRVCDADADAAVVSFHTSLTYAEMRRVCDLVRGGALYIATHPDLNCPTEDGYMPDAGANIAFIEASAGRLPDRVIGKPSPDMVYAALERFGVPAARAVMIGDRLYTDVAAGRAAGVLTALTLTGESTAADAEISPVKPDIIINSVRDVTAWL